MKRVKINEENSVKKWVFDHIDGHEVVGVVDGLIVFLILDLLTIPVECPLWDLITGSICDYLDNYKNEEC